MPCKSNCKDRKEEHDCVRHADCFSRKTEKWDPTTCKDCQILIKKGETMKIIKEQMNTN